jgi:hypothetical protein
MACGVRTILPSDSVTTIFMPGFNPICLRNKEGMTTQPLEETVTIAV